MAGSAGIRATGVTAGRSPCPGQRGDAGRLDPCPAQRHEAIGRAAEARRERGCDAGKQRDRREASAYLMIAAMAAPGIPARKRVGPTSTLTSELPTKAATTPIAASRATYPR